MNNKFKVGDVWENNLGGMEAIAHVTDSYIGTDEYTYRPDGDGWGFLTLRLLRQVKGATTLQVKSCDYTLIWYKNKLHVGCQHISKKDAEKIFKFLGEQLGYEVEE